MKIKMTHDFPTQSGTYLFLTSNDSVLELVTLHPSINENGETKEWWISDFPWCKGSEIWNEEYLRSETPIEIEE